ncbi:hypothetical protein CRUP_018292, partial [Coryphaenoides rupestris]
FQNQSINRAAILAELDKKKRQLIQNQSMNTPGGQVGHSPPAEGQHTLVSLSRPNLKEFRDNAEQQHIAAQQKAALQDSSFGNLILPVLPRLEAAES